MNTAAMYSVLLIDDDPLVRRSLGDALARQGLEVRLAADGLEAVQAARQEIFDLILLDVRMPGRGGPAILRALRDAPHTSRTRAWLLADDGDAELVDEAMREVASGVLRKDDLGADGVAAEVVTILAVEAAQEPPRRPKPRRVANVPAAVDEIARRFRAPEDSATGPIPRGHTQPLGPPPPRLRPRDAVDSYEQQAQIVARPLDESSLIGSTRFAPRRAPGSASDLRTDSVEIVSRADVEQTEYDTLLNRFACDAPKLIEELGVPIDLICTGCKKRLVLRLRPDEDIPAGVRGRFACATCDVI